MTELTAIIGLATARARLGWGVQNMLLLEGLVTGIVDPRLGSTFFLIDRFKYKGIPSILICADI